MMKYAKCAAAVLTAGLGVSALAGCSQLSGNTSQSTGDAVYATFNGKEIPMDYVKFQLNEAQYEYEAMFSQYFGTTDFWSQDLSGNGSTMEETVINNVLTGIQQTAILNWYAEKNNITLTDEQQKKVADAVKSAMEQANSNPDYASAVGVTEDLIRQVYQENAIANAVYMQLVADVDTTVGDDEFIQKDFTYIRLGKTDLTSEEDTSEEESLTEPLPGDEMESLAEEVSGEAGVSTENSTEKAAVKETTASDAAEKETAAAEQTAAAAVTEAGLSEGETAEETSEPETTLSAEEQEQVDEMNTAAEAIEKRLQNGEDAADIVADYSGDSTWFNTTTSTATLGSDSSYVYTEAAFALNQGETTIYTDSDSGAVYILLCTNDNDEDARQSKIDEEINNRKETLFESKYPDITSSAPRFTINQNALSTINFDTPLYVAPEAESETELESEGESMAEPGSEAETVSEAAAADSDYYDTAKATEAFTSAAETARSAD